MKKKVSMQTTDGPAKVHGMYGSIHADMGFFENTGISGLRGMDLGFLTGFKNRRKEIRPNGKNGRTRRTGAAAGAIAVERHVYVGGMNGFGRLGKIPGSARGNAKAGAASAGVLRRPAGRSRTRTRAKEQENLLSVLGRSFSVRGFLLLMLAALSISAALVLMLFNYKKAIITGNTKYSQKQIESFITQGKLGENTFVMAMKYHNRTVKGVPFVDRIDVDILSPSTVKVNITEKPLDGYVVRGDDKIYFSREGVVQTISGRTDENVTLVNGIELVNPETDAQVQAKNQSGMDNVLTLLSAMDRYDLKADSIDVDRLGSITVRFGDVRLTVGKTGYDMKMYKVHQIFPFFKGKSGCISMTGSDFRGDNIVLSPVESRAGRHSKSDSGKKGDSGGKHGASKEPDKSGAAKSGKEAEEKKDGEEDTSKKDTSKNGTSEKDASEKDTSKKDTSEKDASEKDASEEGASKKGTSEKGASEKENSGDSGNEKSEIEKQKQKSKEAGESAKADAQKKAAAADPSGNQAEKQKSEEPAQKAVEKEAAPDQENREKTAVPEADKHSGQTEGSAEEKESEKPEAGDEETGGRTEKTAESAGEKSLEKSEKPVKEVKEKQVEEVKEEREEKEKADGHADAPAKMEAASMEANGRAALPASQKPMAPVAQRTAE